MQRVGVLAAAVCGPWLLSIGLGGARAGDAVDLPPEAAREKARLAFLFTTVAKRHPCEIKTQVNEMTPRLHWLEFARDVGPIRGERRIPIAPEIIRVWPLFDELRIHGRRLGKPGAEVVFDGPAGRSPFHFWRDRDVMLAGHANRLRLNGDNCIGFSLRVRGEGRIDRLVLLSRHGVSARFDDSPWSTLGQDQPIRPVAIRVDATRNRAIAGSARIEREKFWRVPSCMSTHPEGLVGTRAALERGFTFGRGIQKLDGLMKWGFEGRKLREDPNSPGKPDYAVWADLPFNRAEAERLDRLFGKGFAYANCFDNWPPFMAVKGTRVPNRRGTPADFHEAARLASAFIGAKKAAHGRTARWWEVKNEATVASEWVLHGEPGVDSWAELARFHNVMARTIHKDHPEVLVGGPTSAWMALHHGGFELARKQLRFMDQTKGRLDFYSHHFYEGKALVLDHGPTYSSGYLMGRLEGCLDLLRNHMVLTGNIKPFVISETGSLCAMNDELGLWINSKNLSSYLVRYLNHTDKIDLVSLWFIPVVYWDKRAATLFRYDETGALVFRPKAAWWMDLWKDFGRRRLPSRCITPGTNVHLHSAAQGQTVWLAVNNLNPYRIRAAVTLETGAAAVVGIEQTRLFFDRGRMHFKTLTHENLNGLPVAVEETSLVKVTLDRTLGPIETLDERTFYGDKVLQPTGEPVHFAISCPTDKLVRARLRICASRDTGFGRPMTVRVNGRALASVTLTPVRKKGNWWAPVTLDVPADRLQPANTVTVHVAEAGGWVTSVALVGVYTDR